MNMETVECNKGRAAQSVTDSRSPDLSYRAQRHLQQGSHLALTKAEEALSKLESSIKTCKLD